MIVHLDTSFLVASIVPPQTSHQDLLKLYERGYRARLSTVVLYEWERGPRTEDQIATCRELFPFAEIVDFTIQAAERAAAIYRELRRPRGREIDIMIAACAIEDGAAIKTLNPDDFSDIPGLELA